MSEIQLINKFVIILSYLYYAYNIYSDFGMRIIIYFTPFIVRWGQYTIVYIRLYCLIIKMLFAICYLSIINIRYFNNRKEQNKI